MTEATTKVKATTDKRKTLKVKAELPIDRKLQIQ